MCFWRLRILLEREKTPVMFCERKCCDGCGFEYDPEKLLDGQCISCWREQALQDHPNASTADLEQAERKLPW